MNKLITVGNLVTTALALLSTVSLGGCGAARAEGPHPNTPAVAEGERLARRYFDDMWNRFDGSVADAIVAEDVVGHVGAVTVRGRQALHARIGQVREMYSASRFTIDEVLSSGDRVAVRWTQRATHTGARLGASVAGREVQVTGSHFFRVSDGRIAEIWVNSDDLGELHQIGLVTPPAGW